jgi:hypothetical protein
MAIILNIVIIMAPDRSERSIEEMKASTEDTLHQKHPGEDNQNDDAEQE